MTDDRPSDHVEDTIQHLADMHQQHRRTASRVQRWADRVTEKKIAKVIQLLEEQRRDNPLLTDRHDLEARDMAQSTDPARSLARLEESQNSADRDT